MRLLLAVLLLVSSWARAERPAVKGLSRRIARGRAERVSDVRYDLFFDLNAYEDTYQGAVTLRFDLADTRKPLTIDFDGGRLVSVTLNGRRRKDPAYNGRFLPLPPDSLRKGPNEIRIDFIHPYSRTGAGLYRFRDPADGKVYLYTDFEPYDANRLFPCFDQPDIKARYTLKVAAPAGWHVITSVLESRIGKGAGGKRLWTFPESPPYSTYLFSMHAGPYVEWKSSFQGTPLRLFSRRSLAPYVPVDDWFRTTREGLGFFNKYFDYPYPFGKYDQVIVPDFNAGAMENVAAVTFSERYIKRGKPTWRQREDMAGVILHEMAHMWFGDLVTMKWWDDLWLNESFASYMADHALFEATEFKDAWQSFFQGMKQWAYWEDQLITTHPIEAAVPDTEQAFSNFDGITYGKGGSVLKQVSYLIGPRRFRDGVRRYFKKHAFGNAVRKDFMAALEAASGRDLSAWTEEWLKTAGLNSLKAEYECGGGVITSFKLLQSAPKEHPRLRRHRTQIGFLGEDDRGRLLVRDRIPDVDYAGRSTDIPDLNGKPCPSMVIPNLGDHDYVKVRLDERTLKTVKNRLADVGNDLNRAMFWLSLWNMVEHAELSVVEYAELVLRHLPKETNFRTLAKVLESVYGRRMNSTSVLQYLAADGAAWHAYRTGLIARLETFFWSRLKNAAAGSDRQKLWLDSFVRIAQSPAAQHKLSRLLAGERTFPGLSLDQDRRWNILAQLNRHAAAGSRELIAGELKRDHSRRGQTAAIRAEVMRPEWALKKAWLERIVAPDPKRALAELKAAMRNIFPFEQAALRRRFAPDFYAHLKTLAKSRPNEFLETYAEKLVPATCRAEDDKGLAAFIEESADLSPVIMKEIKVARQENDRCLKVRALARPLIAAP